MKITVLRSHATPQAKLWQDEISMERQKALIYLCLSGIYSVAVAGRLIAGIDYPSFLYITHSCLPISATIILPLYYSCQSLPQLFLPRFYPATSLLCHHCHSFIMPQSSFQLCLPKIMTRIRLGFDSNMTQV